MMIFFIHGVATKNVGYSDALIRNIRKEFKKRNHCLPNLYPSFWGNLFENKKYQINDFIEKDLARAYASHAEYKDWYSDVYRYKRRRKQLINNFIGDFLIYQNPERGKIIRKTLLDQLNQFAEDHSDQGPIHLVAHSLGSFILWDLLFSNSLPESDPAFLFREQIANLNLESITTLGSPLLFIKQMLELNFSTINDYAKKLAFQGEHGLRWVNVIHSSDLIAYPLRAAIENEIGPQVFFSDQYVWQDANGLEKALRSTGQSDLAMVVAAEDAHSSYFYDNLDGAITARIITQNLLGETDNLENRCIAPR